MITFLPIGCESKNRRTKMKIEYNIAGRPILDAPIEYQLIAVLVKKLGGEQLINLKNEVAQLNGFMFEITSQGNYLIKAE